MAELVMGKTGGLVLAGLHEQGLQEIERELCVSPDVILSGIIGFWSRITYLRMVGDKVSSAIDPEWNREVSQFADEVADFEESVKAVDLGDYQLRRAAPALPNPSYSPSTENLAPSGDLQARFPLQPKYVFLQEDQLRELGSPATRLVLSANMRQLAVVAAFEEIA